jgi:hypothetical protein
VDDCIGAIDSESVNACEAVFNIIKYIACDAYGLFAGAALHMQVVLVTACEAVERAFSYIIYKARDRSFCDESFQATINCWF